MIKSLPTYFSIFYLFIVSGDKGSLSSTTQSQISGTPISSKRQNISSTIDLSPIMKRNNKVNICTLFRRI